MKWRRVKLGEVMSVGRGSSPRPIKDEKFFLGGNIPWVKIADATASGKCIFRTNLHINEYGASFSRKLQPGALIFPASGTLGIPRFLGVEACIHDGWLFFSDYQGIDPDWLYYRLTLLKSYFEGIAYGAAIQNINTDIVRNVEIELPEISEQLSMASVLKKYDDLIEVNQRRMDLLEESARLIYVEWFLNFRFPGNTLSNGKVPSSWIYTSLASLCGVNNASLSAKDKPLKIKYIDIASVGIGTISDVNVIAFDEAPSRARRLVKHGDVIWSCVRPNRRSYALMWEPESDFVVSTGFAVLSPERVPFSYLYFATTSDEFVSYLTNRATGAAYPAVSSKDFEEAIMLLPSAEILEKFHMKCLPLLELRNVLMLQNKKLSMTRDALLPKLMSGELSF